MCEELSGLLVAKRQGKGWTIDILSEPDLHSHGDARDFWRHRGHSFYEDDNFVFLGFVEWVEAFNDEGNAVVDSGKAGLSWSWDADMFLAAYNRIVPKNLKKLDPERVRSEGVGTQPEVVDKVYDYVIDRIVKKWGSRLGLLKYLARQMVEQGVAPYAEELSDELNDLVSPEKLQQLKDAFAKMYTYEPIVNGVNEAPDYYNAYTATWHGSSSSNRVFGKACQSVDLFA